MPEREKQIDLSVDLAGVTLKNPVAVASGTFGFGREYGQFFDLSELGAICWWEAASACRR